MVYNLIMVKHNIHLVSDSTGGTLDRVMQASLAMFEDVDVEIYAWPMTRTCDQMQQVTDEIKKQPGLVFYTLVSSESKSMLEKECSVLGIAAVSVLDPVIQTMSYVFEKDSLSEPGLQHKTDNEYYTRMEAVEYAFHHDDGREKDEDSIADADVIIVGLSKTSKTPTCVYLANKGIKVSNIPYVVGEKISHYITELKKPLFIALSNLEKEKEGQEEAMSFYKEHSFTIIDVSNISVEETASEIINLLKKNKHRKH